MEQEGILPSSILRCCKAHNTQTCTITDVLATYTQRLQQEVHIAQSLGAAVPPLTPSANKPISSWLGCHLQAPRGIGEHRMGRWFGRVGVPGLELMVSTHTHTHPCWLASPEF